MVLTEYAKTIALIEDEGYRPLTIVKMLKSKDIFVSRRGVAKFYQEYTVAVKKTFPKLFTVVNDERWENGERC